VQGEREGGDGSARCGGKASVCLHGAERSEGSNGRREGHARVGILFVRRRRDGELDREGAGRGHTARMGVPVHGAYTAQG
jgi:hypothetical protein